MANYIESSGNKFSEGLREGGHLQIESTDSQLDQRIAETQPYNVVELVITTGQRSMQREDGTVDHIEPDTQSLSALMPGRELRDNLVAYNKRVEEFKRNHPDFDQAVNQDVAIPISVRDEIFRMPNGPAIAHFLAYAPEVIEQLSAMHPLDAARCVQCISEDLNRGELPGDESDYDTWKKSRNGLASSKTRRGSQRSA